MSNTARVQPIIRSIGRGAMQLLGIFGATFLLSASAFAQQPEIVAVSATGYGVDIDAAKKAAGRAAIEQVVGQLVDAETLVENDELVKDRILTYSGAFLEDIDIVGKPAQADGLWTVKVLAKVRKGPLVEKLAAEGVTKAKLKKGKLFAQATSRAQEAQDAGAMLAAAFEGFPQNVVKFEVCKNADGSPAVSVASADGKVEVEVELSFDKEAWKAWANALVQKLDKMASSKETAKWDAGNGTGGREGMKPDRDGKWIYLQGKEIKSRWGVFGDTTVFRLAVASVFREGSTGFSASEYVFSGNNAELVRKFFWKALPQEMELTVSLMADDEMLESKTWRLRAAPGVALYPTWGGSALYIENFSPCLVPAFCSTFVRYLQSARFKLDLGKVPASVLADATDVETSVRFLVPDAERGGTYFRGPGPALVPMKK